MSKKQFDHIEERIREAAENSGPAFDMHAWELMEVKLDKEKKGKKRFFIWWFSGLLLAGLLAGPGYYLLSKKAVGVGKEENKIQATTPEVIEKDNKTPSVKTINAQEITNDIKLLKADDIAPAKKNTNNSVAKPDDGKQSVQALPTYGKKENQPGKNISATSIQAGINVNRVGQMSPATKGKYQFAHKGFHLQFKEDKSSLVSSKNNQALRKFKTKGAYKTTTKQPLPKDNMDENVTGLSANNVHEKTDSAAANKVTTVHSIVPNKILSQDSINNKTGTKDSAILTTTASLKKRESPTKKVFSRFYVLGTGGADIAGVRFLSFQNNTATPKFGIGVGYNLSKKLSIQTGFYAGRKKYVAGPDDYNPKSGSYWAQVQIIKVDASCLVYDIPLTLRYNVLQKKSSSLYVTAGLSSFIMKKEDYNYHYFSNSTYHASSHTYTGNRNFFSNAGFSIGYERKLGPTLSIIAEPSVSIPIAGVGDGKVKLYSASLQTGIKFSLAKKSKRTH